MSVVSTAAARRAATIATAIALIALPTARAATTTPRSEAHCGARDLPETGLQGEVPRTDQLTGRALHGYNCGLALVGHVGLRGASANMAWAGHCAYVASAGTGINVIDVANPAHPVVTTTLKGSGSNFSIETIAAHEANGRAVLVAGRYGPIPLPVSAPMDIYDATDCAHPHLVTTFNFPENIHNLTFSPDGDRVYTTLPLQVLDITNLAHPRYVGDLERQIPEPSVFRQLGIPRSSYLAHEVETSPDGNTLYLGGQTPEFAWFTIVDITGWPQRPPRVLSQVPGRGHSMRLATIAGRTYALHSEESVIGPTAKSCVSPNLNPFGGISQPWLSDITDPVHPRMRVSQMTLAINDPSHCAQEVVDGENASVHYHDVDDPANTTFVMASMWDAGLRLFDVRDALHPREVAYFNPGMWLRPSDDVALDKAWGHVHYEPATGQIWFATQSGGFWVVELEPQTRAALGLLPVTTLHPAGNVPRPPDTVLSFGGFGASASSPEAATEQYYCTIGPVLAT